MNKEKSTEKIDGAVAAVMALDRALMCGEGNTESVYDKSGIFVLHETLFLSTSHRTHL